MSEGGIGLRKVSSYLGDRRPFPSSGLSLGDWSHGLISPQDEWALIKMDPDLPTLAATPGRSGSRLPNMLASDLCVCVCVCVRERQRE